jgi:hypothetical protein
VEQEVLSVTQSLEDTELELAIELEIDRCLSAVTNAERVEALTRALDLGEMRLRQMQERAAVKLLHAAPGVVQQSAVRMRARFSGALANLKDR